MLNFNHQNETSNQKRNQAMILFNVKDTCQLSDGFGGWMPPAEITTESAEEAIKFAASIANHSRQGQCHIHMIDTASVEGSSTHKTFQGTMTAQQMELVHYPSEDLLNAVTSNVRNGRIISAKQRDNWAGNGYITIH